MIKPTIGRIVWYWPTTPDTQPRAAIVTRVWSDTCVNLAIFDPNGNAMSNPPTSVLLLQEGNERPSGGGFCEWMPYQIGQAKKHEAESEKAA